MTQTKRQLKVRIEQLEEQLERKNQIDTDRSDVDRPRGVLSPSDRRYLLDPEGYVEEYSKQAGYERRSAVDTRIQSAVFDLALLCDVYDERDVEEISEDALVDGIAFLRAVKQNLYPGDSE